MIILYFLLLWDATAKSYNTTEKQAVQCNTLERNPVPHSVYAPNGQPPLAPYKWICNIFEAECTAFMIRHQTNGVLIVTSGSCLFGRNAQNTNGDIDCPIFGPIRTDINNYVYHPIFLDRQAQVPPVRGHAYDLAGLFDTSLQANRADGTPDGFTINFPNAQETTLKLVGYIGTTDLTTQYEHDCLNVEYKDRFIEYESPAKWGDCVTTGSPIFRKIGNDYQVFAVNQDDVLFATSINGEENTRYDCYGYAAYCQGVDEGGAYGYEELLEGGAGYYGYGYGTEPVESECQLPQITGCEFYGSTVDAQMVQWKEDGTGWMWGDPHYVTMDGKKYNFYEDCAYYLIFLQTSNFNVVVKNYRSPYSVTKSVSVRFGNNKIDMGQGCEYRFFGTRALRRFTISFPFTSPFMTINRVEGRSMEVIVNNGAVITWDCRSIYRITLPESLRGNVQGLLGNWNEDPNDDCRNLQNQVLPCNTDAEIRAWVNVWQFPNPNDDSLCGRFPDSPFAEDLKVEDTSKHAAYTNLSAATAECALMNGGRFNRCPANVRKDVEEGCVIDLQNEQDGDPLCDSFQALADTCQPFVEGVLDWRKDAPFNTLCPEPQCPPGQAFNSCADICKNTCADYTRTFLTKRCKRICTPLCECTGEKAIQNGQCVPFASC